MAKRPATITDLSLLARVVLLTPPVTQGATVISSSRIDLAWSAVVGAASYRVYRAGVLVDSPTGLTSSSTGLTVSTLYSFQISSVDAGGLEGPKGSQFTATTLAAPDTIAPSIPGSVAAAGTSQTTIRVAWTASTDTGGSGLAGYRVYRSTTSGGTYTQIGGDLSAATLLYDDASLSASTTMFYKVLAFDAATNASSLSPVASGTTTTSGSATAIFTDDFTTGNLLKTGGGFNWGGGNQGSVSVVNCTSFQRSGGSNRAVAFDFNVSNNAELRWSLATGLAHLWLRYYIYYPDGTESPSIGPAWRRGASNQGGATNCKFARFQNNPNDANYANFNTHFGCSTEAGGGQPINERIFLESGGPGFYASPGSIPTLDPPAVFPNKNPAPSMTQGAWHKIEFEVLINTNTPSGWGQGNGILDFYVDDVIQIRHHTASLATVGTTLRGGYLMGFPNAVLTAGSKMYMTDFAISSTGRV